MTQTHIKLDAAIVAAMIKAREVGVKMLASDCEQILSAAGIDGQFMDCGHHKSLLLTSAETGEPLYCEYCDMRDQRNDLLASAPEVGEAVADKVERNYVYEDGIEPGYDKEPAVILALRNTELQKRVEQLEDLLSSAYNIANRNGEDTHWFRFAAQLHVHGISPVTAKTFKILPSDEGYQPDRTAQLEEIYGYVYQVNDTYTMFSYKKPPEDAYDEGTLVAVSRAHYSTEKKLQVKLAERDEEIERLQSYEQGLNAVIAWMKERGLYWQGDHQQEGADFAAILTEHEQQVSAQSDRKLEADKARMLDALRKAAETTYSDKLHVDWIALIAEMEAKG